MRSRPWVPLVVCALLLTACGARWTDEQQAAVLARDRAPRGADAPTGSQESRAATVDTVATPGADGGSTEIGAGGDEGAGPAAEGSSGVGGGDGEARPCAAPSDAPGVSRNSIAVGSITSLSGPVPGLGLSALDGARAYIAYRNATGGVCGRQLEFIAADDGTDNARYRATVEDLAPRVIGVVGGFAVGDAGGADLVEKLQLPVVFTATSAQAERAATVFDINPPFADVNAVIGKYRYLYDQGLRSVAIVTIASDLTRSEIVDKQRPQMEAAGLEVVLYREVPLSTLSYDSAAREVANSGADYLFFLADATLSASMARSMADTGYTPEFSEYVQGYGQPFLDLAGVEAAEGAVSWIRSLPVEEPNTNAEQRAYLDWMARVAPGTPADVLAADGWSSAKALVDALDALDGPISRERVLARLRTMTEYDAGGLLGEIDLGRKLSNGCFIAMKVVGGRWTRLTPAQGFLC